MIDAVTIWLVGVAITAAASAVIWWIVGSGTESTEANPQRMLLCHGPSGKFLHLNIDDAERLMRSFEDGDEWTATWLDLEDAIETFKDLNRT